MKTLILLIVLILCSNIYSQNNVNPSKEVFLNLDFEKVTPIGNAKEWYHGGEGFLTFVDSTVSFSGKRSLCIENLGKGNFGVATSTFPFKEARGKSLKYTGYIKTEGITQGYAGLWWRADGPKGMLKFDNMYERGAKGTSEWTKYTIELKIDDTTTNINFGVLLSGNGKAWFDSLSIELDGKIYQQKEPEIVKLSSEQIEWLKNNVQTFKTAEPIKDDSDLDFLKDMVGNAKIVSLGEGTHGTSEFFKMKHRITKYLVEHMGFTVFAMEANMPEASDVNSYVLHGTGNPKDVLAGLYFWTWNTQEVLDMIEWMHEYNASAKGKVEFWGFDMQFPNIAMRNVLLYLNKYDPTFYETAKNKYQKITLFNDDLKNMTSRAGNVLFEPYLENSKDVYNHLIENRAAYNAIADKDSTEWGIQNSRIVVQSIEQKMQNHPSRDESMALNVQWILDHQSPDTKIILWAHNAHVSQKERSFQAMGAYLKKVYQNDMVVMGFGFNNGKYTAVGNKGLGTFTTSLPEPGSVEWMMHSLKLPRLFLDLRKVKHSPLASLYNGELEFRTIGALAMDYAFYKMNITDEFDVLIFFDETTPTNCFGRPGKMN